MRTSTVSALALSSLLFGCAGEAPLAEVVLLPCPAGHFSIGDAIAEASGDEMPALEPGPAVRADAVAKAAPQRARIGVAFFERFTEDVIVAEPAKDLRRVAPAVEDGFAAMGGGVTKRRVEAPSLRAAEGEPVRLAMIETLSSSVGSASRGSLVKQVAAAPTLPLDQETIGKTVRQQMPRIRACYERVIKQDPAARGKIVMRWTISADGSVNGVGIESDEVGSEQFAGCASRSVAKWRFPKGVEDVAVAYPFVMAPRSY
jgi:hypothetical protein